MLSSRRNRRGVNANTTAILQSLNLTFSLHSNASSPPIAQFTLREEIFLATQTFAKDNTKTIGLNQGEMQTQVLLLLPKFLNSHKAYLYNSDSENNLQQIYINSRDDNEVKEFVRLFGEAGFSGSVIKSTDCSVLNAGHSMIKLNASLPELLLRLRKCVEAQELKKPKQEITITTIKCNL